MFTLEALRAKHGDALLLHYGTADPSRLIVIDGGPSGVWSKFLSRRLGELRLERDLADEEPLVVDLLMVSHIDDDHIRGVIDWTGKLVELRQDGEALPYDIRALWHNSFDDIIGGGADQLVGAGLAEVGAASAAAVLEQPNVVGLTLPAALVLASVPQGRTLRQHAAVLGLDVNPPAGGGLIAAGDAPLVVPVGDGLELVVLGPPRKRVEELRKRWDEELTRLGLGQPASVQATALLDESVFNLSSIVVLARSGGKSMLLTGDARADDVLAGLRTAGLLDQGNLHVDLLKVPHHGSDRNVDTEFFRTVTADHYVISGDGRHGNPEPATFEMLLVARGNDAFTLHLTYAPDELGHGYPVQELAALFAAKRAEGGRFQVVHPAADEISVSVPL